MLVAAAGVAVASSTASAPSVSLQIKPSAIVYGHEVLLRGRAPRARAREQITVLARTCSFTGAVPVKTLRTRTGGAFSFRIGPTLNTTYVVSWRKQKSRRVAVAVAPDVDVDMEAAGRFRVSVSAGGGSSFAKKKVLLQRRAQKKWRTVGSATLALVSPPDALTSVSRATVSAHVARGTKLRAVLPPAQARPCYRSGISSVIER